MKLNGSYLPGFDPKAICRVSYEGGIKHNRFNYSSGVILPKTTYAGADNEEISSKQVSNQCASLG